MHRASGAELERHLAFGVAQQLFEGAVRRGAPAGAAGLASAALLEPAVRAGAEAMHATLHGLYWLGADLAARAPQAIVVDDLHWADPASIRSRLSRATARGTPDPPAPRAPRAGTAARGRAPARHRVRAHVARPRARQGRHRDAARERVRPRAGAGSRRGCAVATGGNPFLLRELLASAPPDGRELDARCVEGIAPATVAASVLQRVAALGAPAVAVAEAVAVLSGDADLARVASLSAMPARRAAAVIDDLAAAGVLGDGTPTRFVHPVMRSAVHEHMPAQRRAMAHLAAARQLLREDAGTEKVAPISPTPPAGARLGRARPPRRGRRSDAAVARRTVPSRCCDARTRARGRLRRAAPGADACGASRAGPRRRRPGTAGARDRARAHGELRTAGARPRRDRLRGPEALTAAERHVAELASDGLTNRQIAQALFLTIKTVETHMSHVLAKLGIRGRDELATALAPGGAG